MVDSTTATEIVTTIENMPNPASERNCESRIRLMSKLIVDQKSIFVFVSANEENCVLTELLPH